MLLSSIVLLGGAGGTVGMAADLYAVIDIGPRSYGVTGINATGQVVGTFNDNYRAYLWCQGGFVGIGTLGGPRTDSRAINDLGQITGTSYTSSSRWHAFLWDPSGTMTDLGLPSGYIRSRGNDVNNKGQVAAIAWGVDDVELRAFLWEDGVWADLGTLGGTHCAAVAINNLGQVVGRSERADGADRATLWRDGEIIDLGDWVAKDINDSGDVLGQVGDRAIVWRESVITDLGTLGGHRTVGSHLDELGRAVGMSYDEHGEKRGFVWENGVLTDVNTLLIQPSFWTIRTAIDINEAGWILAAGAYDGMKGRCLLIPNCNGNKIADDLDISRGTSIDCNANLIPDECELVGDECAVQLGDVNNDGEVDDRDLSSFIKVIRGTEQSLCAMFAADVNRNGVVDAGDTRGFVSLLRCHMGYPGSTSDGYESAGEVVPTGGDQKLLQDVASPLPTVNGDAGDWGLGPPEKP